MRFKKFALLIAFITSTCLAHAISVTAQASGTNSPLTVKGTASSTRAITGWAIYIDSVLAFRQNTSATQISQSHTFSTGTHQVVVRAWDSSGAFGSAYLTANVYTASGGTTTTTGSLIPTPPSWAKTWTEIEEKTGWKSCGACAGNVSGSGPVTTFWFKQWITSPALSGKSMEGYIGGYVPYANDLFYYYLGPQNGANHAVWSASFLWNAPKVYNSDGKYVIQAMEFDSYFSQAGFKYMFGSQCDFMRQTWDIWNNTGNYWQHTGVTCKGFAPNQWHTITWFIERDPVKKYLHYAALKVDATEYKINIWVPAVGTNWGDSFGVQWQQDSDRFGNPWYEWVDKIKASVW